MRTVLTIVAWFGAGFLITAFVADALEPATQETPRSQPLGRQQAERQP